MYDFKPGDRVQIDVGLILGGARKTRGVGVVVETRCGYTETQVRWGGSAMYGEWCQTHDLVPVADTWEATK